MVVRTVPRPTSVRCINSARAIPSTNSMATETTVMMSVTQNACQKYVDSRTAV